MIISISRKEEIKKELIPEESKANWAKSGFDSSESESSRSESDEVQVQCPMGDADLESTYDEVFDLSSTDFTRDDLVTAPHDMVNQFKRISQSFEKVKANQISLTDKDIESNWKQSGKVSSIKSEITNLKTEYEMIQLEHQQLIFEHEIGLADQDLEQVFSQS